MMQAIYVADIVLLLVLCGLVALLCGYGAYAVYRVALNSPLQARLWHPLKRPPVPLQPATDQQHYNCSTTQHQQLHYTYCQQHDTYNCRCLGYLNPLSPPLPPRTPSLLDRHAPTSALPSPSPHYERVHPASAHHDTTHILPPPLDNRLYRARDWRYTEYQI